VAIKGVDHVVIRVKDLDQAVEAYRKILDVEPRRQSSAELKADQAFFQLDNGTFVELIMPTDDSSPVAGPLEKRGEGIHTIAFAVDSREETAKDLESKQLRVIGGTFVHPASAHGVLLQLSET
jgi:methylmalonyl-CoA/ethylmalonyl-CoA epimerase